MLILVKVRCLNLFNRFLHITPIKYLIGYRLKKAALLIKNTEKKINNDFLRNRVS